MALTIGVAHWGIDDPRELRKDPNGLNWVSTTGHGLGKSLMSYSNSGIGISHADVGDLQKILHHQAEAETHADRKAQLLKIADKVRYGNDRGKSGQRTKLAYPVNADTYYM